MSVYKKDEYSSYLYQDNTNICWFKLRYNVSIFIGSIL